MEPLWSPVVATNEAAVFGLTRQIVGPISKGAGVLVVADDQRLRVEALD